MRYIRFRYLFTLLLVFLFSLEAFAQPCTPAANPFCFAPINLTVGGPCVNGTTCNGMGFVPSTCNTADNQGVWYSFVATDPSMTVAIDLITNSGCDFSSTVYAGICTSGIIEISCLSGAPSDDSHILTGLVIGNTYSIEVSYNAAGGCGGPNGSAEFCIAVDVTTGGVPNDEPCTATVLPVNVNCVYQTSTNDGATDTPGVTPPGCANYLGSDVWFSAVVPPNGAVDIGFLNGVLVDGGAAVYTGPDCSNLTLIACDDDSGPVLMPGFNLFGLTPGSTIWIRVWEHGNNNNGDFEICASIGTPPVGCTVTNLSCALATSIIVDDPCVQGSTCNGGPPTLTSCNAAMTEGTWFTFVATDPEMSVYINHVSNTGCYYASSVFSGSCGSLTELSCESGAPLNDAHVLSGLTIGDTYYVQVSYPPGGPCGNNGYSEFCISVIESPCQGGSNNSCVTAEPFCTGTTYSYCNTTGIPSAGIYSCLGSTPNPMWMYLQIDTPGPIDIQISQTDNFGGTLDVDFAMYGPYASVADACNNITPGSPTVDCSYSAAAVETANFTGGAPGEVYLLLITNYSNNPGFIEFSQTGGAGTTDCSIILPCSIAGTSNDVSCSGGTDGSIDATWTGTATYTIEVLNSSGIQVDILNGTSLNLNTFTGLSADTYTLNVTTADGCTNSVEVIVGEPSVLASSNVVVNATCVNPLTGSIEITATDGTPPYNVSWTGVASGDPAGDEIATSGGTYDITSLASGSYVVTTTDANSCTSVQNITVDEDVCTAPTVSLPAGLPASLDCASADSYATPADATYTNSESGTCEISGTLSPSVTNAFDACSGGTITIDYAGTDACGNALTAQHVITVTPPAAPTVSLPAGLPATLDCASADSYATPADATYTNSESGTCEISGTLSPSVTNAFDACSGGTITIDYAGTDACGNALTAQHVITVTPPAAPTVSLPAGLPATLDCASADSYATPARCYLYE